MPRSANATSTRWVFTLNNYTELEEHDISHWIDENAVYGVFGREVGESGTPHLQGFVILGSAQRLSYLRRNLNARAHYERARGTSAQARDYCRKDGDFSEFGTFPERQGKRTDLDELIQWSDEFTAEHGRPPASPDIAKHKPNAYVKYPRFKSLAAHRAPARRLEFGEPREGWQQELLGKLKEEADDRKIIFVVDPEGNKGKSWFCRYMLSEMHEQTQVLGIGRVIDLAHMLDETKSIFLFNLGRNQMQYLQYQFLEMLKDKMIPSGKYHGVTKFLTKNPHVVVFGNEQPDYNALSGDRYTTMLLDDE